MGEQERAVVITGASTGIGAACALHLDEQGWRVFAGVRKEEDGEALRSRASHRLTPLRIDVADAQTIAAAAQTVREELGGEGLSGLLCNAGIAVGGPIEFLDLEDVRRQFEVNVIGVIATVQAFLDQLRAARGRIVITGSMGGRVSQPFVSPYTASKHALEALADALRIELMPWHIEVSLLEPGAVRTPIWAKGDAVARELLAHLPERASALYGEVVERAVELLAEQDRAGIPPRRVADAVSHALSAERPRTRYPIGRDARVAIALRRWLPDRVFDRLLIRSARLPISPSG